MTDRDAPDHQKISFTAKLVALGRSESTIPFARDVSELVGAPAIGDDIARAAGTAQAMPPVMAPMVEARYLSLASAIRRSGVRQVVEFASGVSLRGLAMALENPDLTYVETDLPDLTAEKLRIIGAIKERRAVAAPRNHHVAVTNILDWDQIEKTLAPLKPHAPVAVVHEGLFMYLSPAEKEVAAGHIARILARFGGVWLTPDFSPMSSMSDLVDDADADFSRMMAVIEERTGRSFAAHSFDTEQQAREFCERLGFTVEERPQLDDSYVLTSLPPDLADRLLPKLRRGLKLWEMRLASR